MTSTDADADTSAETDRQLDAVARAYDDALPAGEAGDFALGGPGSSGLDRTGVHVVAADFADPTGAWPRSGSFGYGLSAARARVAARAELVEEMLLSQHLRELPRTRDSHHALHERLGPGGVVDPLALTLPAGTVVDHDAPRWWLPATRVRTGETVLVPAEFAAAYPVDLDWQDPAERLITVITNGCGAGDTRERALGHALGELLQRDGNSTAFRALDRGIVIDTGPDDELVRDPATRALLAHLRDVGIRVVPKLASTAFGVTDLHVVGHDVAGEPPHPIAVTACGEAADPDREVALQKALLEFCAARVRKSFAHADLDRVRPLAPTSYWDRELAHPLLPQETRAFETMRDWAGRDVADLRTLLEPTVLAERSRVGFDELPTVEHLETPAARLDDLLGRLADFDVLAVVAPAEHAYAVKVIVPGLEVETMSYGRIGRRGVQRLLGRAADPADPAHGLVGLGEPPHAGALPVAMPDVEARLLARRGGDGRAWLDRERVDAVVGELYPLYREPSRHAVGRAAAGERVELR
ncbi:YcaO-like family protein [Actinomycetospora atypica]|uniref:YcaO-like family protein n=1 Tax=Actinomycetospora atypica TaxID=1290095 RepID=A0ABV9YL19_9PSEU